MAEQISWYCTTTSTAGVKLTFEGATEVGAILAATAIPLDPGMANPKAIHLQLDSVDEVVFMAVKSSILDGSVQIQAGGPEPTVLTGPLLLFGDAIGLFATDLTTLQAQNSHPEQAAELAVLVGLNVGG